MVQIDNCAMVTVGFFWGDMDMHPTMGILTMAVYKKIMTILKS